MHRERALDARQLKSPGYAEARSAGPDLAVRLQPPSQLPQPQSEHASGHEQSHGRPVWHVRESFNIAATSLDAHTRDSVSAHAVGNLPEADGSATEIGDNAKPMSRVHVAVTDALRRRRESDGRSQSRASYWAGPLLPRSPSGRGGRMLFSPPGAAPDVSAVVRQGAGIAEISPAPAGTTAPAMEAEQPRSAAASAPGHHRRQHQRPRRAQ